MDIFPFKSLHVSFFESDPPSKGKIYLDNRFSTFPHHFRGECFPLASFFDTSGPLLSSKHQDVLTRLLLSQPTSSLFQQNENNCFPFRVVEKLHHSFKFAARHATMKHFHQRVTNNIIYLLRKNSLCYRTKKHVRGSSTDGLMKKNLSLVFQKGIQCHQKVPIEKKW